MDDAALFREQIISKIEPVLREQGYRKIEEYKGFFWYQSTNNQLVFVYNWNRERTYYCEIRFGKGHEFYILGNVINKMKSITPGITWNFERREFKVRINEWIEELLVLLKENDVPNIRFDTPAIQELRAEKDKRHREYTLQKEIYYLKKDADAAWKAKDYKRYVTLVTKRVEILPPSYAKKLKIAKRKAFL